MPTDNILMYSCVLNNNYYFVDFNKISLQFNIHNSLFLEF